MNRRRVLALAVALGAAAAARGGDVVLAECEAFAAPGGWSLDQQFMDQMGSPYLLAHGLGTPVADATTEVALPGPGRYRVWVRTRDWVGPWKTPDTAPAKRAQGSPGAFRVLVDGRELAATFGAEGAEWHWQDGGAVDLAGPKARIALRDLAGFDGRCDAIALARDPAFVPPNRDPEMAAWRRACLGWPDVPPDAEPAEFVVVGGGIAGTCAAVAAARGGVRTVLIQDRPVLGGNNSSEVRVHLCGARNGPKFPHLGDILAEVERAKSREDGGAGDARRLAQVRAEPNLAVFTGWRANGVEIAAGRIAAVVAQDTTTGERRRFAARWFADGTGDGAVGALAGADFESTPTGHMGSSNLWTPVDAKQPSPFPRCPWALDLAAKPFPGRGAKEGIEKLGQWFWESGFDRDPVADREYVRDWNLRAAFGAWDALKNADGRYPNHRIGFLAYVMGPRESRRLLGDVVVTKEDLRSGRVFEDGVVATGWPIDLHLPDPRYAKGFEGDAFVSKAGFTAFAQPFYVPYRALYSRNVANLFMAGRDISVTHEALGATRVQRTGGLMGEVVGMAAALCRRHGADPRDVYREHLSELLDLARNGLPKPASAPGG